jgi:hypothetical protein
VRPGKETVRHARKKLVKIVKHARKKLVKSGRHVSASAKLVPRKHARREKHERKRSVRNGKSVLSRHALSRRLERKRPPKKGRLGPKSLKKNANSGRRKNKRVKPKISCS